MPPEPSGEGGAVPIPGACGPPGTAPRALALCLALLLAALCLSPAADRASAGTVWREDGSSGFGNGTLEGMALRGSDGALVLDRGNITGEGGSWRMLNIGPPAPRAMAGMAYDPARKVSVLFGGNGVPNETWEYDSSANLWSCYRTDPAPSARYAFGMAYHSGAGVIVLFGGVTSSGNANDTWTYDAGAHRWTRQSPSNAPGARYACGMAFDPATGLIVLFGGYSGGARGDTWVYDLLTDNWTQRAPQPAPSARFMPSMASWPGLGLVVLFGGYGKGDLWTYNASTDAWDEDVMGVHPPSASGALMAYDGTDDVMLLFGGFSSGTYLQSTYYTPLHRPSDWNLLSVTNPPVGRDVPAGAFDSSTRRLVVFGGQPTFSPSPPVGDTWTLDYARARWSAMVPTARSGHSMCHDERAARAVVFGGRDNYDSYKGDTWTFDAPKNLWSSATPAVRPPPRYLAAMAYDGSLGECVLFGGQWPVLGDTWTYNSSADAWTNRTPSVSPPARYSSAMVFDPSGGACLLFGGAVASGRAGDTWAYNASTNTWTDLHPAASPSARSGHAMAFDRENRVAVLFGGNDGENRGDTWTYDFPKNLWTNVSPAASPSPRTGASLVYDRAQGLLVLFGGRDASQHFNDTWAFNARTNTWTMVNASVSPGGRMLAGAVFDRSLDRTVLFGGGAGTGYKGDTWTFPEEVGFRPSGRFLSAPRDTGGEAHFGTVRANFTVPEGGSLQIRLRTAHTAAALQGAPFVGPDGTCSTWYSGGERVPASQSPARWFQYSVELETAARDASPALSDVRISFNRMHRLTLYSPSGGERWLGPSNITWNALDPDGDPLLFDVHLSRDGGATFPVVLASGLTRSFLVWNTSEQPPGKTCRVRVVAQDGDVETPLSAEAVSERDFTILRQNVLPRSELLSPPPGALVRGDMVVLSWTGSDDDRDPLSYFVIIDGAIYPRVEGTGLSVSDLPDGPHRWSVIPNDGFGNGTCISGRWNFTLTRNLPPSATLLAPAEGSLVRARNATLAWSGADGEGDPISYTVIVDGQYRGRTSSTSLSIGDLSNGTHRWTVVPSDALGNGTCLSGTWSFTVRRNRAPDLFPLGPMNGSVVNGTAVELRWSSVDPDGDPLSYTLELSDGAGLNLSERLLVRNRTVELQDRLNYTWRVSVSDGIDTVFGPDLTFRVLVNRRPVIHSVPLLEAWPGRSYSYRVVATDPDSDPLRYRLEEGPAGMGLTPDGRALWVPWTGQAGKAFRVVVNVSDGELCERQEFDVSVAPARQATAAGNPAPCIVAAEVAALAAAAAAMWIVRRRDRARR